MAKFCGHCGAPMDDDARVCGQCGVPIDGNLNQGNSGGTVQGGGKGKSKPWIKIVIALVVVACIAGIAVKVVSNYTGRRGFIRKVLKAYVDYDIDGLMDLASDVYFYKEGAEQYGEMYFEIPIPFIQKVDSILLRIIPVNP